jgi:hypothetical protein
MTDNTVTWIIAGLEVVTALAIAGFWMTWFRMPHDQPWLPDGYEDHEAPFVVSDSVLAVVLVASAVLLVLEEPLGESLALIAGGMLAFLGLRDAAYFARTGMFARARDGIANAGIVIGVLAMAVILIVRFA